MKWWAFAGEVLGVLSSVLLAIGFAPAKGTFTFFSGDPAINKISRQWRRWQIVAGFSALAVSFGIQAVLTLLSPN